MTTTHLVGIEECCYQQIKQYVLCTAIIVQESRSSKTFSRSPWPEFNMPNIDLLPASDFKDLLNSIIRFQRAFDQFSVRLLIVEGSFLADDSIMRRDVTIQLLRDVLSLNQQGQEIDAHYGWVLASDIAMVGRAFGPANGHTEEDARAWLNSMCTEQERIRKSLVELKDIFQRLIA
jgi:hypothetical protein